MSRTLDQTIRARNVLATVVVMAVVLVGTMLVWQPGASAQVDPYASESPTVLPTLITNPGTPSPSESVLDKRLTNDDDDDDDDPILGTRQPTNELPFTGADLTLFVATGLAAIATGITVVRRTRARGHEGDS